MTDWQIAIETSSRTGSIALLQQDMLVERIVLPAEQRTAQTLAPALDAFMSRLRDQGNMPQFIAISQGPGSFTGLRIGVTAAKTLAYALDIPVVPCDTLHVLLTQARHIFPQLACYDAAVHAYRGQVFWRREAVDGTVIVPSQVIDRTAWLTHLNQLGFTAPAHSQLCGIGDAWGHVESPPPHVTLCGRTDWIPDARFVGQIAWRLFSQGGSISPFELAPQYLRESAAVENQKQARNSS
jgi:tRNA threonylcarbamoyladenosine biosynthesis protein TsaB